jgi:hypothetical protein
MNILGTVASAYTSIPTPTVDYLVVAGGGGGGANGGGGGGAGGFKTSTAFAISGSFTVTIGGGGAGGIWNSGTRGGDHVILVV